MSKAERVVEFAHLFQILRQATDMGSLCPLVLATSQQKGRCACQIWQWRRCLAERSIESWYYRYQQAPVAAAQLAHAVLYPLTIPLTA